MTKLVDSVPTQLRRIMESYRLTPLELADIMLLPEPQNIKWILEGKNFISSVNVDAMEQKLQLKPAEVISLKLASSSLFFDQRRLFDDDEAGALLFYLTHVKKLSKPQLRELNAKIAWLAKGQLETIAGELPEG